MVFVTVDIIFLIYFFDTQTLHYLVNKRGRGEQEITHARDPQQIGRSKRKKHLAARPVIPMKPVPVGLIRVEADGARDTLVPPLYHSPLARTSPSSRRARVGRVPREEESLRGIRKGVATLLG